MTNEHDEQEPERSPDANSGAGSEREAALAAQAPSESIEVEAVEPLIEDEEAVTRPVTATQSPFRQQFQKRALKVIGWLIVFFAVATLGTAIGAAFLPNENARTAAAALASDVAKSAIPALIALLGTAAAWAFKDSDKD